MGVEHVYFCGLTPYPPTVNDDRPPHVRETARRQIAKTALGAEKSQASSRTDNIIDLLDNLKARGYQLIALEQTDSAQPLATLATPAKVVLVVGSEVTGVSQPVLQTVNQHTKIPMLGKKESLNVVQAASMALYHFRFS